MKTLATIAGIGNLCTAGVLTMAAIVFDMTGTALIHLGRD
ncbi:hypothetical protein RDE2_41720 [Rhodococcus sp. RDE2]|nr:hypothetical protein RDE2_41720 [Rhodococcus sp. RDE2]